MAAVAEPGRSTLACHERDRFQRNLDLSCLTLTRPPARRSATRRNLARDGRP
jgi:hypothetical protein